MSLLYHHTNYVPPTDFQRTGTNLKIQMTNQIRMVQIARTAKHTEEDKNDEEITTNAKHRADTPIKKRSVFLLKQQIILHCNSLQILSIPTHTARQGSHCSDKKKSSAQQELHKKNATKSATTKTKRPETTKQQSTKHPNTYQYDWHAWLH